MLDNRGAGRTIPIKSEFSVKTMVGDLLSLINCLGHEKVSVLGHSMGGFIAQEYALKYPEKVENLILSNTARKSSYRNKDEYIKLLIDFLS